VASTFLLAAVRAFLSGEPLVEQRLVPAGSLEWDRLAALAEAERLAPLLRAVLRSLPLPVPILDRLRAAWVAARRQHLSGLQQLSDVVLAFESEGVAVIPLKGPVLAEALYPDPGLRPFTDLDLLIRRDDLPRALAILTTLGYRHLGAGRPLAHELAYAGAAAFVGPAGSGGDLPLDLHWELVDHPGAGRGGAMDPREIWERAVRVETGGRPMLSLCPEDLLIYLALHLALHHALAGLAWQLDLALFLRRYGAALDWDGVAERARRWRAAGALYFALRQVEGRLGASAPPALLPRLRPRGPRSWLLERLLRRSDRQLERLDYLVPVLLMDGGSDLLRFLAAGVVPPGRWARSRYGAESLLGAYLAHYRKIGGVCARTVRAGFRRGASGPGLRPRRSRRTCSGG
jgi:hypothetical protein